MAENKKYSRISLDIAEEKEETFHVGSAGVTRIDSAGSASEIVANNTSVAEVVKSEAVVDGGEGQKANISTVKESSEEVPTFKKKSVDNCEDDVLTEADLEGEVPFQKLRIAIIVVMALIVIAAVLYFNMGM